MVIVLSDIYMYTSRGLRLHCQWQ